MIAVSDPEFPIMTGIATMGASDDSGAARKGTCRSRMIASSKRMQAPVSAAVAMSARYGGMECHWPSRRPRGRTGRLSLATGSYGGAVSIPSALHRVAGTVRAMDRDAMRRVSPLRTTANRSLVSSSTSGSGCLRKKEKL